MTPSKDQRKKARKHHCCTIWIRPATHDPARPETAKWDAVTMKDLSESGTLFSHTKKFSLGDDVELRIILPSIQEPMVCRGKVRRSQEKATAVFSAMQIPIYLTAVEFQDLKPEKLDALRKTCSGS